MSRLGRFQGRQILLVGATGNLGAALARSLWEQGAELYLTGRNETKLSLLSQELDVPFCLVDLSTSEGRARLVDQAGLLDGLVYSAGVAPLAPVRYLKDADLEACLHLNTVVPLILARDLLKSKKLKTGSSLVWISSIVASRGVAGYAAYAASKAALEAAARCFALELAPKGMRVNCVAPGMIQSEMADEAAHRLSDEHVAAHFKAYPLGLGRPADVASAISFLLSEESRWITGESLPVDGGLLMGLSSSGMH